MNMKVTPTRGTKDYLPEEVKIRDYIQKTILKTYEEYGFQKITTPILEDIERLNKSNGGENLSLIFQILKRGDKLEAAKNSDNIEDLVDTGLRYDLTLPLSRYYANNRSKIRFPFKSIQMDQVFRAERPQKGRLRQFYQCDIDIIGEPTNVAEIQLIDITTRALLQLGFKDFTVRINDRRILRDMILSAGFKDSDVDSVCITFDKLDKVGMKGVEEELIEKGFAAEVVLQFIESIDPAKGDDDIYCQNPNENETIEQMNQVIFAINNLSEGKYKIKYDKSLVRGMGYYTGMVFEIVSSKFSSSIAGGGRYDNMIGKFLKEDVPAVGFSIGFERIASILLEEGFVIPDKQKEIALLYDKSDNIVEVIRYAEQLRADNSIVSMIMKGKKIGKQIDNLMNTGFDQVIQYGK